MEEAILRHHALSTTRTMSPDEQATTLLVIRIGLISLLSGMVGTSLLIMGSCVHADPLTMAGAILYVAATALLGVATVAAACLSIASRH